ncbi:MAG: hypothetical protein R6V10_12580, partial [bacterium]
PDFRLRQHPDLAMLVFACVYFAAVWLERKAKLKILATHVFKAAKRLFGIPACAQASPTSIITRSPTVSSPSSNAPAKARFILEALILSLILN